SPLGAPGPFGPWRRACPYRIATRIVAQHYLLRLGNRPRTGERDGVWPLRSRARRAWARLTSGRRADCATPTSHLTSCPAGAHDQEAREQRRATFAAAHRVDTYIPIIGGGALRACEARAGFRAAAGRASGIPSRASHSPDGNHVGLRKIFVSPM